MRGLTGIPAIFWMSFLVFGQLLAADSPADKLAFFESRIRPVLIEHCQGCHNSTDTAEGDFTLDSRPGLLKGGQSGPAVVPGKPAQSLLLKAVRHEVKGLEMPDGADRLSPEIIADLERWIADGAVDPRDLPPIGELTGTPTWDAEFRKRLQHWCFQPLTRSLNDGETLESFRFVDRRIAERLAAAEIPAEDPADPLTLLRRLTFVLTGLPPTQEQVDQYLSDPAESRWDNAVDRLLNSPHFGEHWARHWMDWIRYTESHGSEGDPVIPQAWKYRDYLIRALNSDVPYEQLLLEHVAGDLLPTPRLNPELGINESALGTAHWRMVFHGFAPTDALDEKVRFTDDQINVFSQAFLGLTVSCARCHNHKFDPISQQDYYALFGVLGSCRPGIIDLNLPERQRLHQDRLRELKLEIGSELGTVWRESLDSLTSRLLTPAGPSELITQAGEIQHPLHLLFLLNQAAKGRPDAEFGDIWKQQLKALPQPRFVTHGQRDDGILQAWDFSKTESPGWYADGNGLTKIGSPEGELIIAPVGDEIAAQVVPAGVYTHTLTTKHRGMFGSPKTHLDQECDLWLLVAGDGGSQARYVVQNYPRSGTVYPVRDLNGGDWHWLKYDLSYWTGDDIHIELTTAADAPVLVKENERSWFGIRRAELRKKDAPAPGNPRQEVNAHLRNRWEQIDPPTFSAAVETWIDELRRTVDRWQQGQSVAGDSVFLDACLKQGLLPSRAAPGSRLAGLVQEYRRLEAEIPVPNRAPGLWEADSYDQPLFVRGNHKQPANPVPRRFLEAFHGTPWKTSQSGRLELARALSAPDNPLVARVIVNRIWHHLFGEGLVRTPDNFGQLGERPGHPELLDLLALKFQRDGTSIKSLIRGLLGTQAWQRSSRASSIALEKDPENRLLSHAHVRPLDAESLRDAMLLISGRWNPIPFGPPAGFETQHPRRSVYTTIHRNSLNPFLETFNAPVPFATKGRRDATNVPAQSLTLLNDPFVIESARLAAERIMPLPPDQRVRTLFAWSFGRPPTDAEAGAAAQFINDVSDRYRRMQEQRLADERRLDELRQRQVAMLAPIRERLLAEQGQQPTAAATPLQPVAAWDFKQGIRDLASGTDAVLHGTARIEQGALILDGQGHLASPPLTRQFKAKTLEAWVQLANLEQRGGGVITLQDLQGNVFDSIVFGEQQPGRWLAGSNFFRRTRDLQGPEEREAVDRPVHLAITYKDDGTIACYRDGIPYGTPYQSEGPATFEPDQSQIVLGLRHGQPGGNRLLAGRIFAARLYDRALTPAEIAASASGNTAFISEQRLLAACSVEEREKLEQIGAEVESIREQLKTLPVRMDESQAWADLTHALWNLKEFRFLK